MRPSSYRISIAALALAAAGLQPQAAAQSTVCTQYIGNSRLAGVMFDLEATNAVAVTGFDINTLANGVTCTIDVWYRLGTHVGFENSATGWLPLGTGSAIGQGQNNPTHIDTGSFPLTPGQVYGIYIDLSSYARGSQELYWTIGGPTVHQNADLKLTTGSGKGIPAFTGTTVASREFDGCVHYQPAAACTLTVGGGPCGVAQSSFTIAPHTGSWALYWSLSSGTSAVTVRTCRVILGLGSPLGPPKFGGPPVILNNASISKKVPIAVCGGIAAQAVDLQNCCVTNVAVP